MSDIKNVIDQVLDDVTTGTPRVPGVSAAITDRSGTIYEGARGVRNSATEEPFEPDTVCAIFSTTKAIAGTACLQLVEEGRLDLDAPAREYVPRLGDIEVLEGAMYKELGDPSTAKLKRPDQIARDQVHNAWPR